MTWSTFQLGTRSTLVALLLPVAVTGFSTGVMRCNMCFHEQTRARISTENNMPKSRLHFLSSFAGGAAALAVPLAVLADPPLEKFTEGQICIKRNLNGSCSKYGIDLSRDEASTVKKSAATQEEPESDLVARLKQRSLENKARNDEEIATKTFANGQAGEFGPFNRYVPVKHKDTGRFELVDKAELEEMKKAGTVASELGQNIFLDAK